MRQKNGFDQFPEFKSKGIEFEVGDKYLFWQLTELLIRQNCQACSLKPLARYYNENKLTRVNLTNVLDEGLRIGGRGCRINSKVKLVEISMY
jgi:hypothetical protein